MKDLLVVLILFVPIIVYLLRDPLYSELICMRDKQRIEILRYLIAKLLFLPEVEHLAKMKNIQQFITKTHATLKLSVDEYLNHMAMNQESNGDISQVLMREELLQLTTMELSNSEQKFIDYFLSLQIYILSLKMPKQYKIFERKERLQMAWFRFTNRDLKYDEVEQERYRKIEILKMNHYRFFL